jgi:riboflavin-specific deaminase-like protein
VTGERPIVTVKIAQTLDGNVATASGESKWITGPTARAAGHELRARNNAILVGVGTVLADDPELTVRHVPGANPRRIVLDTWLRTPTTARVLREGGRATIIACGRDASPEREAALLLAGATVVRIGACGSEVSLSAVLDLLDGEGIRTVLVEGGPTVATAFLRAGLVDHLVVYVAPMLLGDGRRGVGNLGITHLNEALRTRITSVERAGDDLAIHLDVLHGSPSL